MADEACLNSSRSALTLLPALGVASICSDRLFFEQQAAKALAGGFTLVLLYNVVNDFSSSWDYRERGIMTQDLTRQG